MNYWQNKVAKVPRVASLPGLKTLGFPHTEVSYDPIDRMVRESVSKGLKLFNTSRTVGDGKIPDRWMIDFADGGKLDSDDLIKWRSFWRDPKPKSELDKLLHGGRWGKVWGNRV